ncbi:prephenate dehydrogenase [Salsuginibacillus halophilus]|uniref:Prephenate dehydrogenase n=1 Tax=Salsuginibacillus halophilus TaxID=517424 RepID=A0A2P8HWF8_9BACI|nr:prephenate dehydrogenase [Salsuginibacillus halophilus]PSL50505.1 prephenate dehydrogenase [Salsuginibacillus halophilus]
MARKVCIAGLGLIGGSLALAIRNEHDVIVTGVELQPEARKMAVSLEIVDEAFEHIEEGAKDADLIILSVPVTQTAALIHRLADMNLKPGALITDVGSTKSKVVQDGKVFKDQEVDFIGGHPMAGSHKSGVQASKTHLFENAYYVLTPDPEDGAPLRKVIQLQNWLKGTKAQFIEMTPEQHDKLAGVISHFPHLIASSLVHQVEGVAQEDPLTARLAAGGFRDITRIASASPPMWRDIVLHNQEALLDLLDQWQKQMQHMRTLIASGDETALFDFFARAKTYRDGLPPREKGALPSFYDLYVDVPDHPGVISDVTGILARERISIVNLQILETRNDITGVLRLTFRTDEDRKEAQKLLESEMYETNQLD